MEKIHKIDANVLTYLKFESVNPLIDEAERLFWTGVYWYFKDRTYFEMKYEEGEEGFVEASQVLEEALAQQAFDSNMLKHIRQVLSEKATTA